MTPRGAPEGGKAAGLQVVCEVEKGQRGQVAAVSTDLMTRDTKRGREAGLQRQAPAIPI